LGTDRNSGSGNGNPRCVFDRGKKGRPSPQKKAKRPGLRRFASLAAHASADKKK